LRIEMRRTMVRGVQIKAGLSGVTSGMVEIMATMRK
jgi:hypothetical protein